MADGKQYKVLIIDDEPLNIRFLETLISDEINVIFATSGEDGLAIAVSGQPDLILLDIMMPVMDGYEVCRRLKADQQTETIPVIFVTAKQGDEEEARGLDLGAVDYITKPFNPEIVKRKVTNHIQRIATVRERPANARPAQTAKRGQSRRASDRKSMPSWAIALAFLIVIVGGGLAALQMGLVQIPGATGGSQDTASAPGTPTAATSSQPAAPQTAAPKTSAGTSASATAGNTQTGTSASSATQLRTSLTWVKASKCPEVPAVEWWRFVSHRSIARYVTRNLKGDWRGYHDKWLDRLENVSDIYSRNSNAVTNTGVSLSGDELADYIAKMTIRVEVIDCLSKEADAFQQSLSNNSSQ